MTAKGLGPSPVCSMLARSGRVFLRIAMAAETLADGWESLSCMISASVSIASGVNFSLKARSSGFRFGRPPGLPLTPFGNGLPLPGILWLFLSVVSDFKKKAGGGGVPVTIALAPRSRVGVYPLRVWLCAMPEPGPPPYSFPIPRHAKRPRAPACGTSRPWQPINLTYLRPCRQKIHRMILRSSNDASFQRLAFLVASFVQSQPPLNVSSCLAPTPSLALALSRVRSLMPFALAPSAPSFAPT